MPCLNSVIIRGLREIGNRPSFQPVEGEKVRFIANLSVVLIMTCAFTQRCGILTFALLLALLKYAYHNRILAQTGVDMGVLPLRQPAEG